MKALVLNSGSSSIKFKLFDSEQPVASGALTRLGESKSELQLKWIVPKGLARDYRDEVVAPDHERGLEVVAQALARTELLESSPLGVIGHRVVHGGEEFRAPVVVTDATVASLRALIPLAPLHNPANIHGIEVARRLFPSVPSVAVFDTAFHQTMPEAAYRYAIPKALYRELRVRRYGFHGTSHCHVAKRAAQRLGRPLEELRLITLHLGNGSSACAIERGRSVDTSMGLTPLEGLVMGTRSGDIDPALLLYLSRSKGLDTDALDDLLNRESGLMGLCGDSDMRAVEARAEAGDEDARLALAVMTHRLRKYLGGYLAVLGGADAVIFTGGIGENDPALRARVCEGMEALGIELDAFLNAEGAQERRLSTARSRTQVWVIPTDEELEICRLAVETTTAQAEGS